MIPCIYLRDLKAVKGFEDDTVIDDDPVKLARFYAANDSDAIIVFDLSPDDDKLHEQALDCIKEICEGINIPVYGAGNVKRMEDIKKLLYAGCDKATLNFSKEGITKDLEAMKEAGIGGATIFNIASAVQETHAPTENNPWPHQTYRSDAYWDALKHAAAEAQRLGLSIGLHNTPGYSTTGGPWVTEEKAMQTVVCSELKVRGPQEIKQTLSIPELPIYNGWGSSHTRATFYRDIAVMAVPDMDVLDAARIIDVTKNMDAEGNFKWDAPEGNWTIYRIGHAPTMSNPHPLPDDLIGKVLEVDKMSLEFNRYHWDQMLTPLVEHLRPYIGKSFTHILIDSYEAGDQDWTEDFR